MVSLCFVLEMEQKILFGSSIENARNVVNTPSFVPFIKARSGSTISSYFTTTTDRYRFKVLLRLDDEKNNTLAYSEKKRSCNLFAVRTFAVLKIYNECHYRIPERDTRHATRSSTTYSSSEF